MKIPTTPVVERAADVCAISTPDTIRRDARERFIASAILPQLNDDELRVLEVLGLRMLKLGRPEYGPLDLRKPRDWKTMRAEESADRLFYDACDEIATNEERLERLRCEAADELAAANPVEHGLRELVDAAYIVPAKPSGDQR